MYDEELRIATEAVREAGAEVARLRLRYGRKGGWELVSEADIQPRSSDGATRDL